MERDVFLSGTLQVILTLCLRFGNAQSNYEAYQSPSNVKLTAALNDICDINSKAELTVSWQKPRLFEGNISFYEIIHKAVQSRAWSYPIETSNTSLVIENLSSEGEHVVSVFAVYVNGGRSKGKRKKIKLSDLNTEPVLEIDIEGNVAKWNNYDCDKSLFTIKERSIVSPKWNSVTFKNGTSGMEFILKDGHNHQVCFEIFVGSRVYSKVCHTMSPSDKDDKLNSSGTVWILVSVVGAIVTLVGVFAVISYFMLCRQGKNSVPTSSLSKQRTTTSRFNKRKYIEHKSFRREHVPLNPLSRSPACARGNEDNKVLYAKRVDDSPELSADIENSDKDD